MIGALKQMDAWRSAAEIGRELGVSKHTTAAARRHSAQFGRVGNHSGVACTIVRPMTAHQAVRATTAAI